MNLEQLRAKLAGILAQLEAFNAKESGFSEEEIAQIDALNTEFQSLSKQIEAQEKIEAMKAQNIQPRQTVPAAAAPKVVVGTDRRTLDPKGGFQSAGEFYSQVAKAAGGNRDARLQAGMSEKGGGEDGGFLVPEEFRSEIQKKVQSDASLLPRTKQFKTSSNNLVLPTYELAPWDSSAIQAYWEGEGAAKTASKPAFGETQFRLSKLSAMVKVTDELLEDAAALESFIKAEAPVAIMNKINNALISGSGVGMPHGILNSGFKYKVAKEGSQAADTVVFKNINNMMARLLPQSIPNAVWICNPAVLPQLREMKFDPSATVPVPVYLPANGVAGAPFGTLYGIPLFPMMGAVKALGDEGDIILADLSYVYSVAKTAGIKQDMSTHVYWSTDEVAFKFTTRLAAQCPFKAPITTENGDFKMSAIVTLEDRA